MGEELLKQDKRIFSRIGLAVFIMIAAETALQAGVSALFGKMLVTAGELSWAYYAAALLPQYIIAMPLAMLILEGLPSERIAPKRLDANNIITIILVCFFVMYAGNLVANVMNYIISLLANKSMVNIIATAIAKSNIWASLVMVGIIGPVFEELFFRKLLIGKLRRYGSKIAVIVPGLIFGLAHGNLFQFFYAFGLGMALGFIYLKTGRIIYTISIHILINMLGGVIAPLLNGTGFASSYGIIMFILALMGLGLFVSNYKRIAFSLNQGQIAKWKSAAFINVGMILFFIACAVLFTLNTFAALRVPLV